MLNYKHQNGFVKSSKDLVRQLFGIPEQLIFAFTEF